MQGNSWRLEDKLLKVHAASLSSLHHMAGLFWCLQRKKVCFLCLERIFRALLGALSSKYYVYKRVAMKKRTHQFVSIPVNIDCHRWLDALEASV